MSDNVTVKLGGKSHEEVALILLESFEYEANALTGDERLNKYRDILAMVRNPFHVDTKF